MRVTPLHDRLIVQRIEDGDAILFGRYSGQEITIDGDDYLIMREDDVLAIIDNK